MTSWTISINKIISLFSFRSLAGLDHNVDTSGQSVIVSKTKHSRLPERRFQEYLNSPPLGLYSAGRMGGPDGHPAASCQPHWTSDPAMLSVKKLNILKRDSSKEKDDKDSAAGRTCWLTSGCGNRAFQGLEGRRCRSMEEREEHYNLVRYVPHLHIVFTLPVRSIYLPEILMIIQ